MGSLLKSDLLKLRKSSTFWVCIVLSVFLGVMFSLLYYYVWKNVGSSVEATKTVMKALGAQEESIKEALAIFPEPNVFAYINTMLCDSNAIYISAVVICVFVASEYSMGTIRNSLSRGFSRRQFIASKFISVAIAMTSVIASYVTGGFVTSVCIFGVEPYSGKGNIALILIAYTLLFLGLASFYTMISIVTRKTGRAVAVAIIFPAIVEAIIGMIAYISQDYSGVVSKFWIFRTVLLSNNLCEKGEAYIPILVALGYMFICGTISSLVFRRQEIK